MELEFAQNMAITALVFSLLFILAIKAHEEEPPFALMVFEVIGCTLSLSIFLIFFLISVWI